MKRGELEGDGGGGDKGAEGDAEEGRASGVCEYCTGGVGVYNGWLEGPSRGSYILGTLDSAMVCDIFVQG
jgi:hypothetical protein